MGFIDNLTGKDALEAMSRNIDEMEQVYAAFATRMIEILDKEERLDKSVRKLKEIIAGLSGTDTGERADQVDHGARIERLERSCKWLLGGLFAVLFIAIGLAASGCGGM